MFEGRTSCPETQTDDGILSVRIANLSQRLASVNVVAVDRHRRIAMWVCFLRTLQCFVHMCTLMASFRLEMKMFPVEAAYTKELLLLLRCQPHAIYLMVTLPFCAYNLIRLQGLFIFGIQKWLNSPTGGSKRPMPHATRPPASRAEEAISDRQHLLAAALEITQRSEGRQLFQPLPKVHTSFIKEWTETNPRSYLYIAEIWSRPHRGISGPTNGGMKRMSSVQVRFYYRKGNKMKFRKSIKATQSLQSRYNLRCYHSIDVYWQKKKQKQKKISFLVYNQYVPSRRRSAEVAIRHDSFWKTG